MTVDVTVVMLFPISTQLNIRRLHEYTIHRWKVVCGRNLYFPEIGIKHWWAMTLYGTLYSSHTIRKHSRAGGRLWLFIHLSGTAADARSVRNEAAVICSWCSWNRRLAQAYAPIGTVGIELNELGGPLPPVIPTLPIGELVCTPWHCAYA